MTWKQTLRRMEAESRRQQKHAERASMQRYRELQRLQAYMAKESEKQQAAHEVEQFENYLELLVSMHKDCGDRWDWHLAAAEQQPHPPVIDTRQGDAAEHSLNTYNPGFFERLFGGANKKRAELLRAVAHFREAERVQREEADRQYRWAYEGWKVRQHLAPRILALDPSAFAPALEHAAAFQELTAMQLEVAITNAEPDLVELKCRLMNNDAVPTEELKLTAASKISTKAMAMGKYWALFQDHVCSCAIRAAAETFAVVPVSRVIVNIGNVQLNSSTGHRELVTLLAVHFARSTLSKLNLHKVDPSDAMVNFPHRMKFKKTSGFEPVEPITPHEQWVTT